MASAKKGSEKKSATGIQGAVRFGQTTYLPGQEAELQKAMGEAGVEKVRGFGVDSTDRSSDRLNRGAARRAEIEERRKQAAAEARGEKGQGAGREGAPGQLSKEEANAAAEPLVGATLSDLPALLAGVTDKKVLQAARRKDTRVGAKDLYSARIEELEASEGGEESGEGGEE
jgi:hypothetical protein